MSTINAELRRMTISARQWERVRPLIQELGDVLLARGVRDRGESHLPAEFVLRQAIDMLKDEESP